MTPCLQCPAALQTARLRVHQGRDVFAEKVQQGAFFLGDDPMRLFSQTPAGDVLEYLYFTSPSQSMWSADWLTKAFGLQARQYFLPEVRKFLGVIHKCEGGAGDACVAQLFQ